MKRRKKLYVYSLAAILTTGTMLFNHAGRTEEIVKSVVQIQSQTQEQVEKQTQTVAENQSQGVDFQYWNDCEAMTVLQEYVQAVTDEQSADFIPQEDRIAVFDLDGTLVGEQGPIYFEWMMYCSRVLDDETYSATAEQKQLAGEILDAAKNQSIPDGVEERECESMGDVFAGMTTEEYQSYVRDFLNTDMDRFDGLKLKDSQFVPMLEVVEYLENNDFTVYVVSGTDRDADRVMISEVANIPARQIIGTDYYFRAENQGDKAYLEYQLGKGEDVERGSELIIKDVKMSKPAQMQQEIGQKPVLAFGNSTGDTSMFMYTTDQNPYRSAAFCLLPDDDDREIAYPEKVENLTALCEENGWYTVSMKNDFKTIYKEGVKKNLDNYAWLDRMMEKVAE